MANSPRSARRLYAPEFLEPRIAPATITVTNLTDSDPGSLRQAILDANATPAADTIKFQAGLIGKISLTSGELDITENLTIKGPGIGKLIIDGGGTSRIFNIDDGTSTLKSAKISGLSLINGHVNGGGGAIFATESLTLKNTLIGSSYASGIGGGIDIENTGNDGNATVTISGCQIVKNTTSAYGGGAAIDSKGDIKIVNSLISGNAASGGSNVGGLYCNIDEHGNGDVLLKNVAITNNSTVNSKGGLGIDIDRAGGQSTLISCTISGNTAAGDTGGLYLDKGSATIIKTTIANNTAKSGNGGGIYVDELTSLTISQSKISGNIATGSSAQGGGIFMHSGGVLKLTDSQLAGNSAGDHGGGIDVSGPSQVNITGTTFSGNTALGDIGGGIAGFSGATIKVAKSVFSGNTSRDDGGGIGGDGVNIQVTNSLFTFNQAGNDGGAIRNLGSGNTKITGSKFFDNAATAGSGGAFYTSTTGTVQISKSSFGRNQAASQGGALYLSAAGGSSISQSKIFDNSANLKGGGIFLHSGLLTISSSKITGNFAVTSGGGIYNNTATPTQLIATLVVNNTATSESDIRDPVV